MTQARFKWIMEYKFRADYATEGLWDQAFEKFKADLKEFDKKEAEANVPSNGNQSLH